MPVTRNPRKKAAKSAANAKPYSKVDKDIKRGSPHDKSSVKDPADNGTYDRVQMLSDIIRGAKPNWVQLAEDVGKSVSQCKDIYRKVILPALLDGRDWSTGGNGAWDKSSKIAVVAAILKGIDPNWEHVAAAQGRKVVRQLPCRPI